MCLFSSFQRSAAQRSSTASFARREEGTQPQCGHSPGTHRARPGDLLLEDICKKLGCSERGLSAAHPPRACRMIGEVPGLAQGHCWVQAGGGSQTYLERCRSRRNRLRHPISLQGLFPTQALKAVGPLLLASAQNRLNVFYISMTICSRHFLGRRKHNARVLLQSARSDTSVSAVKPTASIPFVVHVSAASPVFPCSMLTPFKKIVIMEACSSPASFPKQPRR